MMKQITELEMVFGTVEIIRISTVIRKGSEVVKMMREHDCQHVVVVLPLQTQNQMIIDGVNPIRAIMKEKGGRLEHQYFERVKRIIVESQPLLDEMKGRKR